MEFIETYSDDLLYLIDLRDSHATHPGKRVYQPLFQASIARIFTAFMVGNIEAMLETWREKDANSILAPYFISSSNEDRINALISNFHSNNIEINDLILKQYLAIKYLRNTIIHSSWNDNQKEYISQMGFPTDTRNLNDIHLQIIYTVNIEMMKYIAAVENQSFSDLKLDTKLPEYQKFFSKKQLLGYLWNNLEKINLEIYNGEEITDSIIEEAVFDWNLFKTVGFANYLHLQKLNEYTLILQNLVNNKIYSTIPIGYLNIEKIDISSKDFDKLIDGLTTILNINKDEIIPFIEAYTEAKNCYNTILNGSVSSLIKKLSSFKKNILNTNLEDEAELADKIYKLGRIYYDYAEKR